MAIPNMKFHSLFETSGHDTSGLLRAYEEGLCKTLFEKLWEHYPGYNWQVKVDAKQGIATIRIPILMGPTLSYVLHLDKLASDPALRAVVMAGGEILERWRISRGRRFDLGGFLEARRDRRVLSYKGQAPT